jgi:ABC-type amino acid transport substrate-binding protein
MRMIRSGMLLLLATVVMAGVSAAAEPEDTLGKIKRGNAIALGYRESSRPFSFVGDDGKPAGYSVDLCTRVAAAVGKQLGLPGLQTRWVKVTVENRMQAVARGTIDLECGSTTASLSRHEQVEFSLLTFIDGGSLLVTDASGIRGIGTLGGKRVGIIPGTTTETKLTEALRKQGVAATMVQVKDHAAGVAALDDGTADAYASDRVILIGVGRTSKSPDKLSLVDEFFSYEPYGLMLRRGDPAFRLAVNRALAADYRSGDVVAIFEKWFGSMSTAGPLIGAMYIINGLPE